MTANPWRWACQRRINRRTREQAELVEIEEWLRQVRAPWVDAGWQDTDDDGS